MDSARYCITVPSARVTVQPLKMMVPVFYKTCDREVTGQRPHAARSDRHDGVILCRRGAKDRKIFLLFSKGMTSFWVSGVSIRRRPESRRKKPSAAEKF
jgi:hypothetical protein